MTLYTLLRHLSDEPSEVLGVFTTPELAMTRAREVDQRYRDEQSAKWPTVSDFQRYGFVEIEPERRWLSQRADPGRFEIIAHELDT